MLETRLAPATFPVGAGDSIGLIAAITAANLNGQANTIDLTPGVFSLVSPQNTTFGPAGLPAITSTLSIIGHGSTIERDASAPAFRLFTVLNTGNLTLDGVVLTNGVAQGGAGGNGINEAGGGAGLGGAIFNAGSLSLVNSLLTGNQAIGGFVGFRGSLYGGSGGGGGLGGNGGNAAPRGAVPSQSGGGGGGNQANGANGIGYVGGGGGATTGGNGGNKYSAGANATGIGGGGGGSANANPAFPGGAGGFGGGAGGGGGGIPIVATNPPGFAGGSSRFSQNSFGGGGDHVTTNAGGGGAGMGGAVFNFAGTVTITNSTLAGNLAQGGSGTNPIAPLQEFAGGSAYGGAVFNLNGIVSVVNATLAFNRVQPGVTNALFLQPNADGGAIYNLAFSATQGVPTAKPALVTLINSILSGSVGGSDLVNNQVAGSGGATVSSPAPNIVTTLTSLNGAVTDTSGIRQVPAGLDASLRNNGGLMLTVALLPGSAAIDTGNNAFSPGASDQRGPGFNRIIDTIIDLGAYEFQQPATTTTLVSSINPSQFGQAVTFTATVTVPAPGSNAIQGTVTFLDGSIPLATVSLVNGIASFSTTTLAPGSHIITARYDGFTQGAYGFDVSQASLTQVVPAIPNIIAVGADAGTLPQVNVYDAASHTLKASFYAFPTSFRGGVRVAVGDVNGDGVQDVIVGAGPGAGPQVTVFDGKTFQPLLSFYGMPSFFTGGVFVAAGDLDGDNIAEIIVGADQGAGPQVNVFNGQTGTLLSSFYAFAPGFTGGVRVAAADLRGSGHADIIAGAGPGGGPQVTAFDGVSRSVLQNFFAFPLSFTGGIYVAAGDLGIGHAFIIVGAGPGGLPQVNAYDGLGNGTLLGTGFASDPRPTDVLNQDATLHAGVRVGVVPVPGRPEVLTAPGPGPVTRVNVVDGATQSVLDSFFAFGPDFLEGAFVGG